MSTRVLQGEQLRMFMTAAEIRQRFVPGDFHNDEGWYDKLTDSESRFESPPSRGREGRSLRESIRQEGVHAPVSVYHRETKPAFIVNGHHRIAVMANDRPAGYLPVEHRDDANPKQTTW